MATLSPEWMVFQVPKDSARLEQILPKASLFKKRNKKTRWFLKTIREGLRGQKTGYYADQRLNHAHVASLVKGKKVLDAYAYGGGFGLHASIQGEAAEVISVDSSARAGRLIKRNAELNGAEVTVVVDDAINYLRDQAPAEQFDVIIVDPPKFVRSRSHLCGFEEISKGQHARHGCAKTGGISDLLVLFRGVRE